MLQVLQYQKSGDIEIVELPLPTCQPEGILVKTANSLISAGTERASVSSAKSSLLDRAKKQPEQVQLVLDMFKKDGLVATYNKVISKLDSYKTLGYSASGIVIESLCDEFKPGDRVACAGAGYAMHAEIMAIPKNLAVKLPDNVSFEQASYTTLGTIAMQGIRQADLRVGENVAVIGLGLLGQLSIQILKASGLRVVGLDISDSALEKAKSYGCDAVYPSSKEYTKNIIEWTRGIGCDAVIITASTSSNEPVELAFSISRKKGKVVVVGAVGMNIQRDSIYKNEIDFRISCSYGPGRYDTNYEEKGVDYPVGYVRWTENRNMQTFIDLISAKKIDTDSMTTHHFDIKSAEIAYDLILGKIKEPYLGIVLNYPDSNINYSKKILLNKNSTLPNKIKPNDINIGFVGAGSFAQSSLLIPLKDTGANLISVSTATPVNAQSVAKRFNFQIATTDSSELISSKNVNTIFIATRHDSHSKYVIEAIKAGKSVFVEKPLAVTKEQLDEIDEAIEKYSGKVMVGYNRRFSKSFNIINDFFKERKSPMNILYRVNAGFVPKSSWVLDSNNLGRIIGEGCHFIDCMVYLTKSMPIKVYAESISGNNPECDNQSNCSITLKFSDGSIGTLLYLSNADKCLPKEYCEVSCESSSAIMNNFNEVETMRSGKSKKYKLDGKKGHREEVFATIDAIKNEKPMPISYEEIRRITLASFAALESMQSGNPVWIA